MSAVRRALMAAAGNGGDEYWGNVVLLVGFDGTDGSTTFVDESNSEHSFTVYSPAQVDTAISKFDGSFLGDGGGARIVTSVSSSDFSFGTGDFTIEFWEYNSNPSVQKFPFQLSSASSGLSTDVNATIHIQYYSGEIYVNFGVGQAGPFSSVESSQWVHFALVRNGTSLNLYKNGVSIYNITSSSPLPTHTYCCIGGGYGAGYCLDGNIDEFRITKGVARYTSNFTPPTEKFPRTGITVTDPFFSNVVLLLGADGTDGSTTFVDESDSSHTITANGNAQIDTSAVKYGTGSAQFDGTGDYLSIPVSTEMQFGSGDFTIEFWARCTTSGYWYLFDGAATNDSVVAINFGVPGSDYLYMYCVGWMIQVTGLTLPLNTWIHFAITKASGTLRLFVDGVYKSGTYNNLDFNFTSPMKIGSAGAGSSAFFPGHLDEFRITKGVARYTANFTPPTAKFPRQ